MIDAANDSPAGDRPQISYPCPWEYTVIGADEQRLRDVVAGIVDRPDYTLEPASTAACDWN